MLNLHDDDLERILSNIERDLTFINLSYNQITSKGIEYLVDWIKTNPTVFRINLSGNSLKGASTIALANMLKVNQTLKAIYLRSSGLDHEDAKIIAESLNQNTSLEVLDLMLNRIGADWAKSMTSNQTLISLQISDTLIGDIGLKSLVEWLKINHSLKYLNLCGTCLSDIDPLIDWIKTNKTVTDLNLSYNRNIGNDRFKQLLISLEKNNPLRFLDLSDNLIGPLNDLPKIKHSLIALNLEGNDLGGDIYSLTDWIRGSSTITDLNMGNNRIDDQGISSLNHLVKETQTLTTLDLAWNNFSNLISLKNVLEKNNDKLRVVIDKYNNTRCEEVKPLLSSSSPTIVAPSLRYNDKRKREST